MTLREIIERAVTGTGFPDFLFVRTACTRAVREALEMAAQIPLDYELRYPVDIFPPDGTSKDAIAGTALRRIMPSVAYDIRALAATLDEERKP